MSPKTRFNPAFFSRVFRLSCEARLGDCTADPPKDGSATVFKAEARSTLSKEFLIKKVLRSLRTPCLCGEYCSTEWRTNPQKWYIEPMSTMISEVYDAL
jgi:hypothetical protein